MINDEIDSVRINAVNSLCKIAHKIQLTEPQVEISLKFHNFSASYCISST